MKRIVQNKFWNIVEDYNKEKLLYFLIDRPDRINIYGDFIWKNNKGQWHRNYDLPAVIGKNGYLSWRKNNKLHREKFKPAIIENISYKHYYINGNCIKYQNETSNTK